MDSPTEWDESSSIVGFKFKPATIRVHQPVFHPSTEAEISPTNIHTYDISYSFLFSVEIPEWD